MNFNISLLFIVLISFGTSNFIKAQQSDEEQIRQLIKNFSVAVMSSDYEAIANAYTVDGKIMPDNTDIIEGRDAIKKRWTLPQGVNILYHKILPEEIKILNDHAYDYGYYEGKTKRKDGSEVAWEGKYVIVWKKVNGAWKIYLDIWNRVST